MIWTADRAALADRLERAVAAAKFGRADELAAIEAEIDAAPTDPATLGSALFGLDLEGDGGVAGLRYRNWLLATCLRRALDAARLGAPVDLDAIETALRHADRVDRVERVEDAPTPAPDAAPQPVAIVAVEGAADPSSEAAEEISSLRYRAWYLGRRVDEMLAAAREGRLLDPASIEGALAEIEAPSAAADIELDGPTTLVRSRPAPEPLAERAAIEALRGRVRTLETALAAEAAMPGGAVGGGSGARGRASPSDRGRSRRASRPIVRRRGGASRETGRRLRGARRDR